MTSLEFRDPEIGHGVPNAFAAVKNKQTNDVSIFYIPLVMPPTLKKWGHIGFGLSVCMYVCIHVRDRRDQTQDCPIVVTLNVIVSRCIMR